LISFLSSKALSRLKKVTAADIAAAEKEDIDWKLILENALRWNKWMEILDLIEEFLQPVFHSGENQQVRICDLQN
jgi:hypothetical protein